MTKRLSEKQKEEIIRDFSAGKNIDQLAKEFNCSKLTISRNLKKKLGEKKYKALLKNELKLNKIQESKDEIELLTSKELFKEDLIFAEKYSNYPETEDNFETNIFAEITPLNHDIDNSPRKDFSSVPLSEIDFPKVVYMIVDKKIELETKLLGDYPQWQFLPQIDLNRKSIEIYYDVKIAKSFCKSNQKVIKVPNPNVFEIVAPILLARGISRIISDKNLIAL